MLWTRRMQLWQPCRKKSTIRRKFFIECPKTIIKKVFQKKLFPLIFLLDFLGERSFDDHGGTFLPGGCYILAHCPKKGGKKNFYQKNVFRKLSNWTSKTQFWQSRGKTSTRRPKFSASLSEKDRNIFSNNFILPLCSCGKTECSFDNPAEKFLQGDQKH